MGCVGPVFESRRSHQIFYNSSFLGGSPSQAARFQGPYTSDIRPKTGNPCSLDSSYQNQTTSTEQHTRSGSENTGEHASSAARSQSVGIRQEPGPVESEIPCADCPTEGNAAVYRVPDLRFDVTTTSALCAYHLTVLKREHPDFWAKAELAGHGSQHGRAGPVVSGR